MKINISKTGLLPAHSSRKFITEEITFSQMHEITATSNYSNIIWRDGVRKAANFVCANSLILDIDGTVPVGEMKGAFETTENVLIVTSKSHMSKNKVTDTGALGKAIEPADYYHVIIALEDPITDLDTYREVTKNLINKFDGDPSCKDGARFYYGNPQQERWYS